MYMHSNYTEILTKTTNPFLILVLMFSLLYNRRMKKKTLAIGSALILGVGIYIGNHSLSLSSSERDEFSMKAKDFIRKLNRKEYDACVSLFDDTLLKSMDSAKLEKTLSPPLETLGRFYRFKNASVTKRDLGTNKKDFESSNDNPKANSEPSEYVTCTLQCEYKNGPATFTIFFNGDHKISGVYLE